MDEIYRVLKDEGTCWVNLGDTYARGSRNKKSNNNQTLRNTNENNIEHSNKLHKIYMALQRPSTIKDIVEFINFYIKNDDIVFDILLPYVVCFNNKAIDVRTGLEYEVLHSHYCSFTTGYDYIEPSAIDMETIHNIIISIFPNPEIRRTYLSILWSGLTAVRQEKFFMANGQGRNGKGMLNELMLKTLGTHYAYTGHISTLTKEIKSGPNPEVAQLNKKRFVKWEEPNANDMLNLGNIKKITGEGKLNSRECHSNNTDCYLFLSAIFECNKKPNLNGTIEPAIIDRFVDIEFQSYFTSDINDLKNNPAARPINLELKQLNFQERMRCPLFKYLILNADKDLYIADEVKTRTRSYLLDNDEIYTWFIENYELTTTDNPIKIKDILNGFKSSDLYNNMSKHMKRQITEKNFRDTIHNHIELKKYFKDRYKHKEIDVRSVLINWSLKCNLIDDELN